MEENIKTFFTSKLRGHYKTERDRLKLFFEKRERQLAYILLNSLLTSVSKEPIGLIAVSKRMIKDLNDVLAVEKLKKNDAKLYSYLEYEYKKRGKEFIRKKKIVLSRLKGFDADNLDVTVKLGSLLLDVVIKSGIDLFTTSENYKGMIKVHLTDKAMKVLYKHKTFMLKDSFTYLPMVVPPTDHSSMVGSGGYLTHSNISVVKQKKKHLRLIEDDFKGCDRALNILNNLQKVEWCVNERVLEVMSFIIDNNLKDPKSNKTNPKLFGDIPTFETLDVNDLVQKDDYGIIGNDGKFVKDEDYDRYYRDKVYQEGVIEKIVGKRYGYMYAIDVAKRYSKYEKFYFTYQFDYRYRLYPLQQHLNPQQGGNLKALLQLYKGCVLDEDGLYWLKIHGANCYGFDKEPYDVRIAKINEMIPTIKKISDEPLTHLTDWCYSDSPFEFLAFCFSISDYFNDNSTAVHIPVALDATCSGIQIYSGLLRDREGAEAVNVIGDTRNDVYGKVAVVGNQLLNDGEYEKTLSFKTSDGVEKTINTDLEASGLKNNITRRLTKRNVMTVPYSVTARGAFNQVRDLLNDDELDGNIWWKGDKWVVAKLISSINAKAIDKVVNGATRGQQFIKDITALVSSDGAYLKWKSPIFDLPMLQRIPKETTERVTTPFGRLQFFKEIDGINKQKMLSSIAPNFIHNLDATLMYRTVEKCMEDGVDSFWLIHDSYGVLPNDVKYLNKNVREAYIELFSQDILKDWVEQLGLEFDESVMINTLNLDEVLDSKYIFS